MHRKKSPINSSIKYFKDVQVCITYRSTQIHAWIKFSHEKNVKNWILMLNKTNFDSFVLSYYFFFFFVCSISLLPFSNIIIKTFVSTQKNTTDWTRLAIVINNHRSPHKSDKKYEQGTSHRFVRQQKKQWNRSIKRR